MNHLHCTLKTRKYTHLDYAAYRIIETELKGFEITKQPGRTTFMKNLAIRLHTSLSNLYAIVHAGKITLRHPAYEEHTEFSADAAWGRRHGQRTANRSKLLKAQPFIQSVIKAIRQPNGLDSIDETIGNLIRYHRDEYDDVITTKTFYNYIHQRKIDILPLDCPEMTKRKPHKRAKVAKRHKGTSIELRPVDVATRAVFGHWEGDTMRGRKDRTDGAILTLVERQTRFQIVIKLDSCTSLDVVHAINQLERKVGTEGFRFLFRSITFDNGSEFARFAEIAKKPRSAQPRTEVYFAHPYSAFERGSNENGNRQLRRKIRKGLSLHQFNAKFVRQVTSMVNLKKRKILGYRSARELFINQCLLHNIHYCFD